MNKRDIAPKDVPRLKETVMAIAKFSGNELCADCQASRSLWASVNFGVFLCSECAGIHRGLGVHISQVRSVTLDDWTPSQVFSVLINGNQYVNSYLLKHQQGRRIMHGHDSSFKNRFICEKYDKMRYGNRDGLLVVTRDTFPQLSVDTVISYYRRAVGEYQNNRDHASVRWEIIKMAGYPHMNKIPREPSNIMVRLPGNIVSTPSPAPAVKSAVVTPQPPPPQVQQENIIDLDFGEMTSAPPISPPVVTTTSVNKPIADLGDLFAGVRVEDKNHGNDEWPTNTGVSNASLFSNIPPTNDFTKSASCESFSKPSTDQFADFLSFSTTGVNSNNDKGISNAPKFNISEKNHFGYQSDLNNIGSVSTSTPMTMLSSNMVDLTGNNHSAKSGFDLLGFPNSTSHKSNNLLSNPEPPKNPTHGLDFINGLNSVPQSDSKNLPGFGLDFGQFGLASEAIPHSQFPVLNQSNSFPMMNSGSKNGHSGDDKDFILSLYNNLIMGLLPCCSTPEDPQTKTIEKEIKKERKNLRRQVKILLLGAGGSGKTTFLKQMVIIHGAGEFTADENIISAMRILLDARQKLGFKWEKESRKKNVDLIMRFTASDLMRGVDQATFIEVSPIIYDFWKDKAIQQTYEQRNLFQISESCVYFFEHINRVSMPDYYPTNKDILYCRKATRTITEHVFEIQKVPFRFIDVGGQRSQRQKWFQCFSDMTSILFMVASSEYDQVILEDRRTNRVVESKSIFETIVNNKSFVNVSIILFMNKSDLLEEKVPRSDIRQYFTDFTGDHTSPRSVQVFLLDKFEKSRKDRTVPFFYHFTTAIDTDNIRRVFEDCRQSILEQNLKTLMMQ